VLTLFRNEVDNYVYLEDETEAEHDDHGEAEYGGLPLANYLQQDAELDGYELEFGKVFEMERGNLSMSFARDSVSGDFKSGGYIPRIVPARNIYSLSYFEDDLEVKLSLKDVSKQKDVSMGESSTMGYQMLNLKLYKSFELNPKVALSVSAFANNLLDEVARNHTSFVKNEVPLPGRNFGLKLNLKY
jgi:iron complex outermembrane receptor protein